jgi:hypothetical protein
MSDPVDVVIVTLNRPSLKNAVDSVKKAVPNSHIILVTRKGVIGELRNEGLRQCQSTLSCFVDDDLIVNRDWFQKCKKYLEENPSVIAAFGKVQNSSTEGAMVCKTAEFRKAGGYPKLDNYVWNTLGHSIVLVDNAVVSYSYANCFAPIKHTLYWMCRGFNTETKIGCYRNPFFTVKEFRRDWRHVTPEMIICELLWSVKALFVLPFIWGKNRPLKAHVQHVSVKELSSP